jgi:hypothetical protein
MQSDEKNGDAKHFEVSIGSIIVPEINQDAR